MIFLGKLAKTQKAQKVRGGTLIFFAQDKCRLGESNIFSLQKCVGRAVQPKKCVGVHWKSFIDGEGANNLAHPHPPLILRLCLERMRASV